MLYDRRASYDDTKERREENWNGWRKISWIIKNSHVLATTQNLGYLSKHGCFLFYKKVLFYEIKILREDAL
jgi:hypothetical protein